MGLGEALDAVTDHLDDVRRRFALGLQAACDLRSGALVEALASVCRERFLPPGPWLVRGEGDWSGPRRTPDADPRHVYQDVSVAIDPARGLFNGAPGTVAAWIDELEIRPGDRVLHVGCGLGYYSAVMARCVGAGGRVVAAEIDAALASGARANLAPLGWVEVRHGDCRDLGGEPFDAILVQAGVTHPEAAWLDAIGARGRLLLPLTCTFPQLGTLGKGFAMLITGSDDAAALPARALSMVMIYSAIGLRNAEMNARLAQALTSTTSVPPVARLRRDHHRAGPTCWLHGDHFCLCSG